MSQREGYLIIDHRASPGVPEELARRAGLDPRLVGEGKVLEAATLTCAHCRCAVLKNPLRQRERAACMRCSGRYICDPCAARARAPDYSHAPFEKIVDDTMAAAARQQALGSPAILLP